MAQQIKGLEKLQESFREHVLVHLQDPLALRIAVISIIGLAGIGGLGTPLYFQLQTLYQKYYEQQVRVVLIKEHQDVKQIFAEYKQRLSPNTEFIEWVRDIRDICRQYDLNIGTLQPMLVVSKDPDAVRQLSVDLNVTGEYLNMLKMLGKFEYSKVRINVREIKITPSAPAGTYLLRLKLGILMQPPSSKKNIKEKSVPAATAAVQPAVSTATATAVSTPTAATPRAVPAVPTFKEPAVSTAPAPGTVKPPVKAPEPQAPAKTTPPAPSSKFQSNTVVSTPTPAGTASSSKFSASGLSQPQISSVTTPSSKFAPPAPAKPRRAPTKPKALRQPAAQKQAAIPAVSTPTPAEEGELLLD